MLKEFKKFIARGNVMDLAVGVIVGSAFSAIVTSLVDNILMPIIGVIIGILLIAGGTYAYITLAVNVTVLLTPTLAVVGLTVIPVTATTSCETTTVAFALKFPSLVVTVI